MRSWRHSGSRRNTRLKKFSIPCSYRWRIRRKTLKVRRTTIWAKASWRSSRADDSYTSPLREQKPIRPKLPHVFEDGLEAVGEVGHDAVDAGGDHLADLGGLIDGPGGDLEVEAVRGVDQVGGDEIGARADLADAEFDGGFRLIALGALAEEAHNQGAVHLAKGGEGGFVG